MEERQSEQARIHKDHSLAIRLFLDREFCLGKGRNAEVFLGSYSTIRDGHIGNWRLCAIKRLNSERTSQLAGLDEVFALRRLGFHPGIVRLLGVLDEVSLSQGSEAKKEPSSAENDTQPRLLILLEYLPHTLDTFVRVNPQAVDLRQWCTWALELASTLAWLHEQGYVHGDIKKQNILLDNELKTRICDFSAVLFVNAPEPATDVCEIGTPAFRAPELYDNWKPSDSADAHPALSYTLDIFSLGVLLYSLATGEDPSERGSMLALRRRQALFFSSEEQERLLRLELGRPEPPPARPPQSCAVSEEALCLLLDPAPEPRGIFDVGVPRSAAGAQRFPLMLRSQSMREPKRPRGLVRAVSEHGTRSRAAAAAAAADDAAAAAASAAAVSAAANIAQDAQGLAISRIEPLLDALELSKGDDNRCYKDGLPALILPGGGRLPDELRDLIEAMLEPQPEARPTAAAVVATLKAHYHKLVRIALTYFYGISHATARRICARIGVHERATVSSLTETQVTELSAYLSSPASIPARAPARTSPFPGVPPAPQPEDIVPPSQRAHPSSDPLRSIVIEGDLRRQVLADIAHHRSIGTYIGRRHAAGYPVRGQRTQSNARTARRLNRIERRQFSTGRLADALAPLAHARFNS
ncbi:hypothetical protein MCUN1_003398 [Malassezia cuniculi]|uniref:Protein kinase domain-containing protein n=1 Tax=Malassezia cuniculi TaxID=948313 RepID=A0AAF0EWX7_9BASI|nr:hypothetical protein MCUN1_003398 [Malassezia cuniculi]